MRLNIFLFSVLIVFLTNFLLEAKPNASTTGYTSELSDLVPSGTVDVKTDGQIVEGLHIQGTVKINADNVIIRNCLIDGGTVPAEENGPNGANYAIQAHLGGKNLLIENCEIRAARSAGVIGSDFVARRCHVWGMGNDGFKATRNVVVEDCFVEKLGIIGEAHADGLQMVSGSNVIIRGCNFDMPYDLEDYKNSQILIIQTNNGPIDNIRIENNWFNDGTISIHIREKAGNGHGHPTNVNLTGNIFGRSFESNTHQIDGDGTTFLCNVWGDNGELIPGQDGPCKEHYQWAVSYGLPIGESDDADHDNDGIGLFLEYALDLNPTEAEALPVKTALSGNTVTVHYPYVRPGVSHQIEWSSNLSDWFTTDVDQASNTEGELNQASMTMPENVDQLFIRLKVSED